MTTGRLRKTLMVSAALLAFTSLLWLRLDADALNASLINKLGQFSDSKLQAEKTSLSFMHGMGLRLDRVTLDHADFHMQAKHINISIALLPLLLGKTEIKAIDIHDGVFKLKSASWALNATSIAHAPVERIHLLRSRIEAADGSTLLKNMQLDLRGLSSKHETLWEIDARSGTQILSGHGRILLQNGDIDSGFGKLKLANMPVAKFQSLAPASLMNWIEGAGNQLSGTLTMDISKHQTWAIFGEMVLENKQTNLVAKLRGKLSHPSDGKLVWKDSFIHLGQQAVIAIAGSCEQDECSTTLDAKRIALQRWHPFIPAGISFHKHISAMSDLKAQLQWNAKSWQGNARLSLKKVQLQQADKTIQFPDLDLDIPQLSGSKHTWLAKAVIRSSQASGSIDVLSEQESNGDKNMEMETHDADSALWQPLANLLLSSLSLDSNLQGNGIIQGSLHIHQHGSLKKLEIDLDASPAQVDYKTWINKPANTVATCRASISLHKKKLQSLNLTDCQLDASQIKKLAWSQSKKRQQLSIQGLYLNLDQLKALNIPMPENMTALTGEFSASANSRWTAKQTWTDRLNGDWKLQNIGNESWQSNGEGDIKKGIAHSKSLLIQGDYGNAELSGSFNLSRQQGKIDVITGILNWNSIPTLSGFWLPISLHGTIKQSKLTLLQNDWSDLHSNYKLDRGALQLHGLHATLANGQISSKELTFSSKPDGLQIQGYVHGKNIQMDQLQAFSNWIQSDISGTLQANIKLDGSIPQAGMTDWQRSNGDLLIYSGSWKQREAPTTQDTDSNPAPPLREPYAFKKLEFRFRIHDDKTDISDLSIISHEQTYQGKATISPDLHLSGQVQNKADKHQFMIDSDLPQLHWTTPQPALDNTTPLLNKEALEK